METINLPKGLKTIGKYAFYGCENLKSIIIPETATDIGIGAFKDCRNLNNATIEYGITSIGEEMFEFCENLRTVSLPNSIRRISKAAFDGCEHLTINLPDSIEYIGNYAFSYRRGDVSYYVNVIANRETKTVLALWNSGYNPSYMAQPSIDIVTTQTTATVKINNGNYAKNPDNPFSEYEKRATVNNIEFDDYEYQLKYLKPEDEITAVYSLSKDGVTWRRGVTKKTESLALAIEADAGSSYITFKGNRVEGDAKIVSEKISANQQEYTGNEVTLTGLDPETSYHAIYIVEVAYGEDEKSSKKYSSANNNGTQWFYTLPLTLTTLQPKVISAGNVIVAAESNLDDAETNVGFEWRRTDWTDDFQANTGQAFLYEGKMEGYIRNLYTEKLWKYRPYYESDAGNRYYGDWVGIDPTNTSYFEPTVHTYATVSLSGNAAMVKGYVMRGSDNVAEQGFKYWKQLASGVRGAAPSVPKDAMTVAATGTVMEAELTGLDYDAEYSYVAYVKTSENELFYGELQSFQTGSDLSGIEAVARADAPVLVARYDVRGRRLSQPQPGLNILLMSDGSTRKVMVKPSGK